jgi:hypothetical protein
MLSVSVGSPLGKEPFEAGAVAQIPDVSLGIREIGAILPDAHNRHHCYTALFEFSGFEFGGLHI